MALHLGNKRVKGVFIQNAPNTYVDADLTPENMQHGMKGWSHGKLVVGTGKAFAFANYGLKKVQPNIEIDGEEKYGIQFEASPGTNIIIISVSRGDNIIQTSHLVELIEGESVEIGQNVTTGGRILLRQDGTLLKIYFTSLQDEGTRLRYFYGKDNEA